MNATSTPYALFEFVADDIERPPAVRARPAAAGRPEGRGPADRLFDHVRPTSPRSVPKLGEHTRQALEGIPDP